MQVRGIRLIGAGAGLVVCLGCAAGVAFREGHKAELRKDWDTALVDFQKALQSQPENPKYLVHEKLARTQASLFHLRQGRRLLSEGRPDEALGEFQKAVSIDPVNEAAAQELGRLMAAQAAAKRAREKSIQQTLQAREEAAAPAVVRLKPFSPEPVPHFHMGPSDSRRIYETLAKLAGVNIAFTSDFQPRQVTIDLTNSKLDEAFLVLAHETKTFWKAITPSTMLVIPDNPNNRRDYEDEVLKTFYLSNPLQPADRTAILTALKQLLGVQKVIDNPDANAIIIRDTPSKVAAAEKIVRDLDRGKPEILVEVTVVEADRDRIRDLGLDLVPQSPLPSTAVAALGFNPTLIPTTTTTGTTTTTIPTLPFNKFRLYSGDFSIIIPGAVANALLNDTHTRILQHPQIRATDGQKANLKIGNRVPFATGSFLPSFGGGITGGGTGGVGGGFGLLASTQFQYQDVGVVLDITPHLLSNGEVSLKAKIEISSIGPTFTIGGLQEPSFGQRIIEHEIRLKEGEVNLLGGLIETTTRKSVSGLPGLSEIPGLRYLFSSEHTEREETEVLVMLTPRVIRLPEPATAAERAVLVGGGSPAPETIPPEIAPGIPQPQPPGQPE